MTTFSERIKELSATERSEVQLISFVRNREEGTTESRYYVRHSNQKTVLEQGVVINSDGRGFKAAAVITDFPAMESEKEAALKLADWLKRIGAAIDANFSEAEQ